MRSTATLLFALTAFCGSVFAQYGNQERPADGTSLEFIPNKVK